MRRRTFPKLAHFIENEARCHDIQDSLHNIQIPRPVYGIDRSCIQRQVTHADEDLNGILILRRTHPIGIQMTPIINIRLVLERDEVQRILIVLDEPTTPQMRNAFLIARGANHAQSV